MKYYIDFNDSKLRFIVKESEDDDLMNNLRDRKFSSNLFYFSDPYEIRNIVDRMNDNIKTGYCHLYRCTDCGKYVYMDQSEKDWYEKKGYNLPHKCQYCKKKLARC